MDSIIRNREYEEHNHEIEDVDTDSEEEEEDEDLIGYYKVEDVPCLYEELIELWESFKEENNLVDNNFEFYITPSRREQILLIDYNGPRVKIIEDKLNVDSIIETLEKVEEIKRQYFNSLEIKYHDSGLNSCEYFELKIFDEECCEPMTRYLEADEFLGGKATKSAK